VSESPSPEAWSPPPVPTIPGERVYSVSEAIAARDAGALGTSTITLGGYWSNQFLAISCPPPMGEPNKLQLYCREGFGITERYETAWTVVSNGVETIFRQATGPLLQPYVPDDLSAHLDSSAALAPVPIVVTGHFNDPGAADCDKDVQLECEQRFVVESIVQYDPASAPTPPPSPSPSPFPSPPPPGLFDATACAGDVPYSFVGWTTSDELDIPMEFEGHAWAVVTQDVVSRGEWGTDPNLSGNHFNLPMGRKVCLAFDISGGGGMAMTIVNGTAYRLWDDGRRTRDDGDGPGSGDPSVPPPGKPPRLPDPVAVSMRGDGYADLASSIIDWSGELLSARPATDEELALPGSETGDTSNAAALILPDDPRSVLVVMAECGSDKTATVTVTADRTAVLLLAANRTDCLQPGARRGAVLTFQSDVPAQITAFAGL
jgi:hypothetical protein